MIDIVGDAIDVAAVRAAVDDPGFGAILVFEGVARRDRVDSASGKVVLRLEYEVYRELGVPVLEAIAQEVRERWPGVAVAMVHRSGVVTIGEPSVVVAVGAPHRVQAYEASRYAIDALKERLPAWKKEIYEDGSAWKANAPSPG